MTLRLCISDFYQLSQAGTPAPVRPSHPGLPLEGADPHPRPAGGRQAHFPPRQQQGEASRQGANSLGGRVRLSCCSAGVGRPPPHIAPPSGQWEELPVPPLSLQGYKAASQRSAAPSQLPDQLCQR